MRQGNNPKKFDRRPIPRPRISAGVVTHYTDDPYHKNRMPIVEACLRSIRPEVEELVIWDNGSTPEFREMIAEYADMLVLSPNIGLDNAKRNLMNIARGEIFCYSDDDVLHAPGWFAKQYEILTTYPAIGLVSGSPQRDHFKFAISSNLELAQKYGMKITRGNLIPQIILDEYAESVGMSHETHAQSVRNLQDVLLEYKGVKAWAHGHHFQFTCYRQTAIKFFPYSDLYMSSARPLDEEMDKAGYMRLTTYERTIRHMGNVYNVVSE